MEKNFNDKNRILEQDPILLITTPKEVRNKPTMWMGAYFVQQASCGDSPIEDADESARGWYESDIPKKHNIGLNFIYGNRNVWGDDFHGRTDYYLSANLPNGFDGVDSVTIAYVVVHGITLGNHQFVFSPGGDPVHGGCNVRSTDMCLGDNNLRYLFLMSCQSVLTDPRPVWSKVAKGIRAFFGFANNMTTEEDFGKLFWENWNKKDARTTDAFINASWSTSHENIPVVAWCGPDRVTADSYRDNEIYFQRSAVTCRFMSWAYPSIRILQTKKIHSNIVPAINIHFKKTERTPQQLFKIFGLDILAAESITRASSGNMFECYTSDENVLFYNRVSGALDLKTSEYKSRIPVDFSDNDAIELAQAYLSQNQELLSTMRTNLENVSLELLPKSCRDIIKGSGENNEDFTEVRKEVTVIFRPIINNIPTIGTGGVIEITLNGEKRISRVRYVMRDIASIEYRRSINYDLSRLQQIAECQTLNDIANRLHTDSCTINKTEFGFFCANESKMQETARLAFRILIEVQDKRFKQMIEKIYYLEDLERL